MTENERRQECDPQRLWQGHGFEYWAQWAASSVGPLWAIYTEEECECCIGEVDTWAEAERVARDHAESNRS